MRSCDKGREPVLGERGGKSTQQTAIPLWCCCESDRWEFLLGSSVVKRVCRAAKRRRAAKPRSCLTQEISAMSVFGEGGMQKPRRGWMYRRLRQACWDLRQEGRFERLWKGRQRGVRRCRRRFLGRGLGMRRERRGVVGVWGLGAWGESAFEKAEGRGDRVGGRPC